MSQDETSSGDGLFDPEDLLGVEDAFDEVAPPGGESDVGPDDVGTMPLFDHWDDLEPVTADPQRVEDVASAAVVSSEPAAPAVDDEPWRDAEDVIPAPLDDLLGAESGALLGGQEPAGEDLPGLGEPVWVDDEPAGEPDLAQGWDDVPAGNGAYALGLVAAALAAAGVTFAATSHAGVADPPALARTLHEAGVDARVEHGDVAALKAYLARGGTVLLNAGPDSGSGAVAISNIDERRGRVAVRPLDGSSHSDIPLTRLVQAWADSAEQMVVTRDDPPLVVLPVSPVTQLPLEPAAGAGR